MRKLQDAGLEEADERDDAEKKGIGGIEHGVDA